MPVITPVNQNNFLTDAKVELLSRATLAACDEKDGLKDGLITDPRACTFKVDTLACTGADRPDCLTAGQIETVKRIYGGVKLKDGRTFTYGFPVGHEGGATGWRAWISGPTAPAKQPDGSLAYGAERQPSGYGLMEPNFRFLALDEDDPTYTWKTLDIDRDQARLRTMTEILSPLNPDLRPYQRRGGKLIMYHGWSDPGISAAGTVAYYDKMRAIAGGQAAADEFARLFMVPGMTHCYGGPGAANFGAVGQQIPPVRDAAHDIQTALERWVEQGVAPTSFVATKFTDDVATTRTVKLTRPVCLYPATPRYRGTGDPNDAASFVCQ